MNRKEYKNTAEKNKVQLQQKGVSKIKKEMRTRKVQSLDREQHYDEMQQKSNNKAREEFLRKPYGVADQLKKWGIDTTKEF